MIGQIETVCKAKCIYRKQCYWADRENANNIKPVLVIMDTDKLFCRLYNLDV